VYIIMNINRPAYILEYLAWIKDMRCLMVKVWCSEWVFEFLGEWRWFWVYYANQVIACIFELLW